MSQKIKQTVDFLKAKTSIKPRVGIILGSGLGSFADKVKIDFKIPFASVPNFAGTTVVGHSGQLIFGHVESTPVVIMQGRIHFYEGHSMESVVLPTRVLCSLGIEKLVVTNSAGGMGDGMSAGDLMIIDDHINLMGTNPLIGPNESSWGPRFPDMSEAYSKELSMQLEAALIKNSVKFKRGVYCGVTGPSYETPAEVRYLKSIGGHAVGMSTVPEVIIANHMSVKVVGLSCITNLAAGISKNRLTHDEVTETAKRVELDFCNVIYDFVALQ
jgi:purine-nucleoside phosphorylase